MEGTEVVLSKGAEIVNQSEGTTIFIVCLGVIVAFVMYILKDKEKNNNKRHEDNEEQIKKLAEISSELKLIIVELKGDIKSNSNDIQELKHQ